VNLIKAVNTVFTDSVHQVLVVVYCGLEKQAYSLKAMTHLYSVT